MGPVSIKFPESESVLFDPCRNERLFGGVLATRMSCVSLDGQRRGATRIHRLIILGEPTTHPHCPIRADKGEVPSHIGGRTRQKDRSSHSQGNCTRTGKAFPHLMYLIRFAEKAFHQSQVLERPPAKRQSEDTLHNPIPATGTDASNTAVSVMRHTECHSVHLRA